MARTVTLVIDETMIDTFRVSAHMMMGYVANLLGNEPAYYLDVNSARPLNLELLERMNIMMADFDSQAPV